MVFTPTKRKKNFRGVPFFPYFHYLVRFLEEFGESWRKFAKIGKVFAPKNLTFSLPLGGDRKKWRFIQWLCINGW